MEEQRTELPNGWVEAKLEGVADILDSQRIPVNNSERKKRLKNAKTLYPYFGATGQVGNIDDYIFDGEAVLLGEDAAPFLEFGKDKAYLVTGKFWVNNHAHILRGLNGIENKFLSHQLNVTNYRSFVSGTTRLKLTQGSMKNIELKLAPRNEQKRIVDKIERLFSDLDEGESLLKTVQKQLATYRQSVLKAAVTGELTKDCREKNKHRLESGEDLLQRILKSRRENWNGRGKYKEPEKPDKENLPALPDRWVWVSLDQLLLKIDAGKNFRCLERPPDKDEVGVVKISAVTWGRFNEIKSKTITDKTKINDSYRICSGDFLFSRANTLELVGASVVVKQIERNLLLSDKVLRFKLSCGLNSWVNSVLKSAIGRTQIEAFATGNQLSMRNISQQSIKKICVPICAEEEIDELVNRVDDISSQIDVLEDWCATELTRSRSLRQSILKDAFSGKLVPQNPNDEPASELLKRIQAERDKQPKPKIRKSKKKVTAS